MRCMAIMSSNVIACFSCAWAPAAHRSNSATAFAPHARLRLATLVLMLSPSTNTFSEAIRQTQNGKPFYRHFQGGYRGGHRRSASGGAAFPADWNPHRPHVAVGIDQ